MPILRPPRHPLTFGFALSGLALVAGCGAAPAGAATDSPAIGPVRAGSTENFAPFPVPGTWYGQHGDTYTIVVKGKTGTAPREFSFVAASSMVFWLNCIGTGTVRLTGTAIGLKWGMKCGNGDDPAGITLAPPEAAVGKKAIALVTASAGSRWEIRIDRIAGNGT